jgi:hypothetical protein
MKKSKRNTVEKKPVEKIVKKISKSCQKVVKKL